MSDQADPRLTLVAHRCGSTAIYREYPTGRRELVVVPERVDPADAPAFDDPAWVEANLERWSTDLVGEGFVRVPPEEVAERLRCQVAIVGINISPVDGLPSDNREFMGGIFRRQWELERERLRQGLADRPGPSGSSSLSTS